MSLNFRDAGPGDAAALSQLGRATFVETFGSLYDPSDLEEFLQNHSETAWREQLSSPDFAVRVAEEDGRLVGYVKVGPRALPVETSRPALELRQLYVLKPWQGQGVSRPLMDWALAEARRRGAAEVYLSVYTENHRARRFYENYGFTYVGPYTFMVGNQADADEIFRLDLVEQA